MRSAEKRFLKEIQMKITKILPSEATPAKAILDRAHHIALTSQERADLPSSLIIDNVTVEVDIAQKRALEVGDVMLDEAGHFYVVDAAPETVLMIKGEDDFVAEAAVALLNRGIRVAQVENGFAIARDEELLKMLTDAGLEFEEAQMPFDPIKLPKRGHGCCCGGHHHEHGEGCGCGHHHHEHGEGCGCGGEHHHHHHHEEGECCCGGHHDHEHGEGCGCGGEHHHHHHHHEEGECCCGGHHDHEHGEGCGCGGEHHHHHHHEEGQCCCGDHHAHDDHDDDKKDSVQ